MKRLILISAFFTAAAVATYAQSGSSNNDPIFRKEDNGSPKEVRSLGRNPEYPFIKNCSTPQQVVTALKKYGKSGKRGASNLNKMLMDMGYANGVDDLTADDVTAANIPAGTKGNMADASFSTNYVVLNTDGGSGTKAWKISAPSGNTSLYLLGRCGNAFYPTEKGTACITVPVNLTGDNKEVTLQSAASQATTDNVYVYYHRKKHKRHQTSYARAEIPDPNPSRPLLLRTTSDLTSLPTTYRVSATTPNPTAYVCPDKELDVTTNLNVEKESEYTGNYPGKSKAEYRKVSKHAYKKAMRKMAKVMRKENKISHYTGVAVKED
jgi:hypothetical protein